MQLLADGSICMLGREAMVINTGGEKVFVEEVETVLSTHPDVADAAVVGRPWPTSSPARASGAMVSTPPSDAVYYPLYTKCCELDLPLCLNTGIPGPPLPAEAQHPIHLDRVCLRFPELKLCMIHGADPWWDVAIRLMIKYRNLRLMTSAWSPKRLPEPLLHYLRTRGTDRILFASDHPVLSMERCLTEAAALDLEPDVLDAWLFGNASAFFLPEDDRHGADEDPPAQDGKR